MATITIENSLPAFILDRESVDIDQGHTISWADVPAGFINAATGKKSIPAGKAMKYLAGTAGPMIPIAAAADTGLIGLLTATAIEDAENAALTGHGVVLGGVVFENMLPDAAGGPPAVLNATLKTNLNAVGTGFAWRVYQDTRA